MAETGRFFDRDNDLNSHAAIIIELHDYGHKGHVRTLAYVMKERSCVDVNRKRKYTEEACSTSNITHKNCTHSGFFDVAARLWVQLWMRVCLRRTTSS